MPENRYFIDTKLELDQSLTLSDGDTKHVFVLRKHKGDEIELVNGKGELAFAHITEISKRHVQAKVIEVKPFAKPSKRLIIAQALTKTGKLELIVQKCVEMGVSDIVFFPAIKSVISNVSPNQMQRLKNICISALKQCGRLYLPTLHVLSSLKELPLKNLDTYIGSFTPAKQFIPSDQMALIIGPESGFTDEELRLLEKLYEAKAIQFNENTLRAETAAIAGIAIMSYLQGF